MTPSGTQVSCFPNYHLPVRAGVVFVLVLNSFFYASAVFHLAGISGLVPVLVNLGFAAWYLLKGGRQPGALYLILCVAILASAVAQIWIWGDPSFLRYVVFPVSSLLVIMLASRADLSAMVSIVSVLALVVLLLAALSFVAVYLGVEPVLTTENRDGRPLHVFFSSLSNAYRGNVVRPSGIFDEPGALSFFVCAIACLRRMFGKSERLTWVLLGLGFVTLSLAHVIYALFHFLSSVKLRKYLTPAPLVVLAVIAVVTFSGLGQVFQDRLIARFDPTGEKIIAGDNRSERLMGGVYIIQNDPSVWVVGIGPECVEHVRGCEQTMPPFASAPLEPLVLLGAVQSWPYYWMLVVFFLAPLMGRRYWVVFGFGLLLLQRPYIMHLGYSFVSFLIFAMTLGVMIEWVLSIKRAAGGNPVEETGR